MTESNLRGADMGPRELSEWERKYIEEKGLNPDGVSHLRYEGEQIIIYFKE